MSRKKVPPAYGVPALQSSCLSYCVALFKAWGQGERCIARQDTQWLARVPTTLQMKRSSARCEQPLPEPTTQSTARTPSGPVIVADHS
jgi:hypothetical protein